MRKLVTVILFMVTLSVALYFVFVREKETGSVMTASSGETTPPAAACGAPAEPEVFTISGGEDNGQDDNGGEDQVIINAIKNSPDRQISGSLIDHADDYRIQILYTQIKRKQNGTVTFIPHKFHVEPNYYFYPASSIKLAAVLCAADKLNNQGAGIESLIRFDTGEAGYPANYIRQILNNSDNVSFDKLFDIVGHEYFNRIMWEKGYDSVRVFHRLSGEETGRYTHGYEVIEGGAVVYSQEAQSSRLQLSNQSMEGLDVGEAYFDYGILIDEPMNFYGRNTISMEDLQGLLKQIFFPESIDQDKRFNLSSSDLDLIKAEMLSSSGSFKWFFCGGADPVPEGVRIYNKSGDAYGFLTDNAYILDEQGNEFFLTATMYCNDDGIMNDGLYSYYPVGMSFFKELGYIFLDVTREKNNN